MSFMNYHDDDAFVSFYEKSDSGGPAHFLQTDDNFVVGLASFVASGCLVQ